MLQRILALGLSALIISFCACSDDDDNNANNGNGENTSLVNPLRVFPNGLPASVNEKSITTDSQGRVIAIGDNVTFEYADAAANSTSSYQAKAADGKYDVIMRSYYNSVLDLVVKLNVGSNGFASDMVYTEYYEGIPDEQLTIQLSYDAAGHLTKQVQQYEYINKGNPEYYGEKSTITWTYTWQSGNLTAARVEEVSEEDNGVYNAQYSYVNSDGRRIYNLGGIIVGDMLDLREDLFYAGLLGVGPAQLPMELTGDDEFFENNSYQWTTNVNGLPTNLRVVNKKTNNMVGNYTFTW